MEHHLVLLCALLVLFPVGCAFFSATQVTEQEPSHGIANLGLRLAATSFNDNCLSLAVTFKNTSKEKPARIVVPYHAHHGEQTQLWPYIWLLANGIPVGSMTLLKSMTGPTDVIIPPGDEVTFPTLLSCNWLTGLQHPVLLMAVYGVRRIDNMQRDLMIEWDLESNILAFERIE